MYRVGTSLVLIHYRTQCNQPAKESLYIEVSVVLHTLSITLAQLLQWVLLKDNMKWKTEWKTEGR